jgi:N-acetylglucosamine-6-phosphate deacetylase
MSAEFGPVLLEGNIPGVGFGCVEVKNQEIASISVLGPERDGRQFISPGFIDTQINGFGGVDFSAPDLQIDQLLSILPLLWKTGVTSFCPTLITASHEQLLHSLRLWESARRSDARLLEAIPCMHLEGPFFPNGKAAGVHNPKHLRLPSWDEFEEFQTAARGNIGIVTLAPELAGALDFIRRASDAGVIVSLGHTEATAEEIYSAVNAGARLSTHLGNGCPQLIDRHQAPLWAQLASDELCASMICDTFHLPREVVKVFLRAKGIERCILVTDAIHVAGLAAGSYLLGTMQVELLQNGQVVKSDRTSLAGSSVSLNRALSILMNFGEVGLTDALRTATENPARLLSNRRLCSKIEKGQPANLVLFDRGNEQLKISTVLVRGKQVYP